MVVGDRGWRCCWKKIKRCTLLTPPFSPLQMSAVRSQLETHVGQILPGSQTQLKANKDELVAIAKFCQVHPLLLLLPFPSLSLPFPALPCCWHYHTAHWLRRTRETRSSGRTNFLHPPWRGARRRAAASTESFH